MSDRKLDLTSEPKLAPASAASQGNSRYLGILFSCCQVYARIAPDRQGRAYRGHCPRCGRPITIGIGPGGTSQRFFTAR